MFRRAKHRPPERCYPAFDERVSARFVRLRSGLNIRLVAAGPRDGRPVVLLPGWGVSAFTYRYQLPALAAAGYRATAVDLKGHGFSDKPTGPDEYTFEAMVAHTRDVMRVITNRAAVIVAQSMAAPPAVEVAATDSGATSALVLVSPVGLGVIPFIRLAKLVTPRPLDAIAPFLARRWVVRAGLALVYGDRRRVSEDTIDEYWAPAQFPGFARALRALAHDFRWSPLPPERLASLDERTLVVRGARDRIIRDPRGLTRRLSGSSVVVVEDAGHAVNEERPDPFNAAMLAFLDRLGV